MTYYSNKFSLIMIDSHSYCLFSWQILYLFYKIIWVEVFIYVRVNKLFVETVEEEYLRVWLYFKCLFEFLSELIIIWNTQPSRFFLEYVCRILEQLFIIDIGDDHNLKCLRIIHTYIIIHHSQLIFQCYEWWLIETAIDYYYQFVVINILNLVVFVE